MLDQLNAAAAPHGLQFGPDVATSSRANVGGMIGNNSAGARSIWHGKTVDSVIALDVVLSDGTLDNALAFGTTASLRNRCSAATCWASLIAKSSGSWPTIARRSSYRFPPILRRVSGYNLDEFVPECRSRYPEPRLLTAARANESRMYPGADFNLAKLLVGAEGGLGTVTEALVHLLPLPKVRGILVLHFDSMAHAVASVGHDPFLRALGRRTARRLDPAPGRKELWSIATISTFVVGEPESLVLVEFCGDTPDEVQAKADELIEKLRGQPGLFHVLPALEKQMCDHVWACRKAALPLLLGLPGTRKPVAFVEDGAVAPEHLPRVRGAFRRDHGAARHRRRVLRPRVGRLPAHSPDARPARAGRYRAA